MNSLVRAILSGLGLAAVGIAIIVNPRLITHFHLIWVAAAWLAIDATKSFRQWQDEQEAKRTTAVYRQRSVEKPSEELQQAALKALADAARGRAWITRLIVVCISVPTILELFVGVDHAVAVASVEPVAIRSGEWWRLLGGTYLHGSYYHYAGNLSALLLYGSILETKTSRYRLPLVYLLSCLGGSYLSFLIPPDVPSIGASGGIVGIIGYLFFFSRRRDEKFPAGFRAATASVFVGLITAGAIGFWYIDNPGHIGGALTGIILAALLVDQAMSWGEEISLPVLDFFGIASIAVLVGGAIVTSIALLR